ncbi:MAG: DUF1428 domain-containing protein [Rhodocyclaceae bacterium]|nr:DUF1428 domain-containing protein [Rhodocyclaceae bacterium]
MPRYVDGYLIPVSLERVEDYRQLARQAEAIWREHGALDYWECEGEDLATEGLASMRDAAGAGPGDTVIFSWIVFESRAHRDRVNAAVMADPRIQSLDVEHMPFDCRRMAYGGFVPIVPA